MISIYMKLKVHLTWIRIGFSWGEEHVIIRQIKFRKRKARKFRSFAKEICNMLAKWGSLFPSFSQNPRIAEETIFLWRIKGTIKQKYKLTLLLVWLRSNFCNPFRSRLSVRIVWCCLFCTKWRNRTAIRKTAWLWAC